MIQKKFTLRMLERRGLSSIIIDEGIKETIEYVKTTDALIIFVKFKKINIEIIKLVLSLMKNSLELVILVYSNSITSDAKRILTKIPKIQLFTFDEMSFDLIDIVPNHSIVKEKFNKKYPSILTNDIVSRYYNFKCGDVIKVEEDDGTISFKKCVPGNIRVEKEEEDEE